MKFEWVQSSSQERTQPGEAQHGKRQRIDTNSAITPEMQELCDLLVGKSHFGESALYAAMSYEATEAVKEYGDLLKLAPPGKRCDLLLSRNEKNECWLAIALRRNEFALGSYCDHAMVFQQSGFSLKKMPFSF